MSNLIKRLRPSIAKQIQGIKLIFSIKKLDDFALVLSYHLQQILIPIALLVAIIVTVLVMLLRIDTKYSMFTGEFSSKMAYLSMDISIGFLWIVTIIGLLKLYDLVQVLFDNFRKEFQNGQ